jgi:phosphoribosylaminoimidazole carboxylase PurE protein
VAKPQVAILLASDSDWPVMEACCEQLREFGVEFEVAVMSAHRTPERVQEFATTAVDRGFRVIVAAAGMAAALPGMVAALTTLPVIGVPLESGSLQGLDALLSMVQMPPGVPVATVAIGRPGAQNAAILATQILATQDDRAAASLKKFKRIQAETVDKKDQSLRERLNRG